MSRKDYWCEQSPEGHDLMVVDIFFKLSFAHINFGKQFKIWHYLFAPDLYTHLLRLTKLVSLYCFASCGVCKLCNGRYMITGVALFPLLITQWVIYKPASIRILYPERGMQILKGQLYICTKRKKSLMSNQPFNRILIGYLSILSSHLESLHPWIDCCEYYSIAIGFVTPVILSPDLLFCIIHAQCLFKILKWHLYHCFISFLVRML